MIRTTRLLGRILWAVSFLLVALPAHAEVTDFGGYPERFKGDGDKEPPGCQIDIPAGSKTPFFIKWNCSDNEETPQNIRTELWIFRKGAAFPDLLRSYLGFPAFAQITAETLGVQNFTDGLPVSFRLIATDRAGTATVSKIFTVGATGNSISSCNLQIVTEATESTGDTTGVPAQTLKIENAAVTSNQSSDTQIQLLTSTAAEAELCEIELLCDGDLNFSASVTIGQSETTASFTLTTGLTGVALSGTSQADSDVVTSLSLSGTTEVDGTPAEVTLSCGD